ncbi:MAG TPA: four helix bundle protein [Opitutaceae bacterium]|nr:four helix bundle protein [Opitutaceae bacterium]
MGIQPQRDLVKRTFEFARRARGFVNGLPQSPSNFADGRQLLRSSGSVAANYLEAQEGLSRRDFFYRIKVCRKEARESELWLHLLDIPTGAIRREHDWLIQEIIELKLIFSAIAKKDNSAEET